MACCGTRRFRVGERLLVRALRHADRIEDESVHQSGKRFAVDIGHRELLDGDATAGEAEDAVWHQLDAHGRGVGGFRAVENLRHGWYGVGARVAGKPVHTDSGGMRDEAPQRDFFGGCETVVGHTPAFEILIDWCVQRESILLNESQHRRCRDWLTDRRRLKALRGRHGAGRASFANPETVTSADPAIGDHCNRDAGHFAVRHPVGKREGGNARALHDSVRSQSGCDP